METKHTPGPWIAERIMGNYAIHSESGVFKNIALVPVGPTDARLIAAAPELLEALKKVAQSLEWHAHGCCRGIDAGGPLPTNEAVELAKRTIAKATGHDG